MTRTCWLPTIVNNAQGRPRNVGIELEFSEINHAEATTAVAHWAGQPPRYQSLVEATVSHAALGDFQIEVDWRYLKEQAQAQKITEGSENWVKFLREAARLLVPIEIITPPIAADQLPELEFLIDAVRSAGAQGTSDSPIAAYGLHINAEVPRLSAPAIVPYIQAFALLQWWLVERHRVDLTRRLTSYVDLYPDAYLNLVLGYRQIPSMDHLLEDYFVYNPTRNRALDLWPLFAEYSPDRVDALMHEPLIKARPAFHYRLPNCEIDRADWRLWSEWEPWLTLEKLAADPENLGQLTDRFFFAQRPWLGINKRQWIKTIEQWLSSPDAPS
jgi:hypothetical protein